MRPRRGSRHWLQRFLTPASLLLVSFAAAILVGALALMSPTSTTGGQNRFVDALFTATSAVCVTGLAVVDTGTFYTRSGQVIILCLIQLGGLGIITFSVILLLIARRSFLMLPLLGWFVSTAVADDVKPDAVAPKPAEKAAAEPKKEGAEPKKE